jgi:hypothetical protein
MLASSFSQFSLEGDLVPQSIEPPLNISGTPDPVIKIVSCILVKYS